MNQELFKAFNTAFSRAKKSGKTQFVVPDYHGIFISQFHFSIKNNQLYYIIKSNGVLVKFNHGMVFNMGEVDNLQEGDYS